MWRMQVPSRLIGPVVPDCGIGSTKMGTPRWTSSRPASVMSLSCCSGATVQFVTEKQGRSVSDAPQAAS